MRLAAHSEICETIRGGIGYLAEYMTLYSFLCVVNDFKSILE